MKTKPCFRMRSVLFCLGIALALTGGLWAQSPEEKGLEVAKEAARRDEGFGDSTSTLEMILRNKKGQESKRQLRIKTLEDRSDGNKTMVVFDEPKDVQGTALLTWSHQKQDDEQWLYLPAIKRVKRISGSTKSGPFMGSEFSYEDMSSQQVEKFTYKLLDDAEYEGMNCFVLERYPVDKTSGYSKQVAWLDKAEYRIQKVDYFDRKDGLLKTLTAKDYKQHLDKFWRPAVMEMVNHQSGKSTTLLWKEYEFKTGLTGRDFDKNSLKRAR